MTQKSESRTNGPHVAAKEGPTNFEDRNRWSDENQGASRRASLTKGTREQARSPGLCNVIRFPP